MTEPADRESTAFHEAGHAVIGRILDRTCGDVTIVPNVDNGSAGCAIIQDVWNTVERWMDQGRTRSESACLRARIITYMAGAEAEIDWFGACAGGDNDDRWQIDQMLNYLLPPEADLVAYERRLRTLARSLVRRHRARIGLVAAALVDHQTLTDFDVMRILMTTEGARRDEMSRAGVDFTNGDEPGVKLKRQREEGSDNG